MKWSAAIANTLWVGSSLPAWLGFRRALSHPVETQRELLHNLIRTNSGSAYGRAHHFGEVNNYEEFARRVPLVDYDDLAPWIDRIRLGESRVLTSDAVTHLIPTSGSTGARKLIPFTPGLQKEFDNAIAPWIADLARQRPEILPGPAYWSITPAINDAKPETSPVPVGFADDASYLGGVKGWLVRAAMVVPDLTGSAGDLDEFRHRTLLCLLRERDLRLISIWHPSFLALLLAALPEYWSKLLAQLQREKNHRYRELQKADPGQPETVWPRLRVISCWGDGHAKLSLADLHRRFPNAFIQAKGLLATEAFATIPFAGSHPVAVRSHFFEFIDERGQVRLVHELREQETYAVVVTTAGGLWRYRMGDRIQVESFLDKTPSLRFIGRVGNVSDLFGEKLSEAFVAKAIQDNLMDSDAMPRFALLAPDQDATGWRYTLYVEGTTPTDLEERLELRLRQNPQYAHCPDLGQLNPVRVFAITGGGYEVFATRFVSDGKRLGDIKPVPLSTLAGWSQIFQGSYAENSAKGHAAGNFK